MPHGKREVFVYDPSTYLLVGLWWYDDSHKRNLNDRVCSYVLLVVFRFKASLGVSLSTLLIVTPSYHTFSQSLSLRVFNSELWSQVVFRILTRR